MIVVWKDYIVEDIERVELISLENILAIRRGKLERRLYGGDLQV